MRRSIEKLLEWENSRLYHKVGAQDVNQYAHMGYPFDIFFKSNNNNKNHSAFLYAFFAVVFALEAQQKEVRN